MVKGSIGFWRNCLIRVMPDYGAQELQGLMCSRVDSYCRALGDSIRHFADLQGLAPLGRKDRKEGFLRYRRLISPGGEENLRTWQVTYMALPAVEKKTGSSPENGPEKTNIQWLWVLSWEEIMREQGRKGSTEKLPIYPSTYWLIHVTTQPPTHSFTYQPILPSPFVSQPFLIHTPVHPPCCMHDAAPLLM